MASIGPESAGYCITTGDEGVLQIESWGFWTAQMAAAFEFEALVACHRLAPLQSCEWDAAQMKPQGEHGQIAIRKLMSLLGSMGVPDCQIIADNALTLMQLRRLARECGLHLAHIRNSIP